MTLVELLVACVILVVVMAALSNVLVSGLSAGTHTDARLTSQQSVRVAFDRLEYETRCASAAQLVSGGAGVALTLPAQCPHAVGQVAWCVTGGALQRIAGATTCTGTAETFVSAVTSATPFSCIAPVGSLPRLQVTLTVNTTGSAADATTAVDTITLRNATATTAGTAMCS